ncbi:MAG: hypothetical protein A3F18_08245 [Legionellales bacterium RIFCSPHIGHO2_12_FULL_37_14]|nr:MAG: hypothetical protein A3F18_08245 [Legionellales bacterium RIFCSPHIGHO2_12_FULL_37_14]
MQGTKSTVNAAEIAKFHQHAQSWWDLNGPFKTLHHLNPVRVNIIESLCKIKNQRILDLGCGGGVLAEALAKKGAKVTAIDADEAAIKTAKNHAREQGITIDYQATSIEKFTAKPFDIITCFELIEHVDCPETIIKLAQKNLKKNGYIFLSTINRNPRAYFEAIFIAEYVLNLLPKQTHDYKKCIRPSFLAELLRANKIEPCYLKGIGYNPFTEEAYLRDDVEVNYVMAGRLA